MAVNLLDLAKAYLNDDVVSQVSKMIGEKEQTTQTALNGVLPAVLGGIAQKVSEPGGTSSIMDMIGRVMTPNRKVGEVIAPDSGVLGQLDDLLAGKGGQISNLLSMGSGLITSIFGDKAGAVAGAIANYSGVKQSSASSLMSLAGPVLLSLIGKKMADDGTGPSGLASLLSTQTPHIQAAVPSGLSSLLSNIPGLGLLGTLAGKVGNMASTVRSTPPPVSTTTYSNDDNSRGGGNRWLPWLLLGLGAIGLFFLLRSCNGNKAKDAVSATADSLGTGVENMASGVATAADSAGSKIGAAVDSAGSAVSDAAAKLGAFFKRKLPNGIELNIPEFGIENKLIGFIEDKNKVVDKTTWFNFDRLLFDTGKTTLKPESVEEVKNIAEILKAFPSVNIKIGGYTDNTGGADINKKLSQGRADAVMSELVKLGIDKSRLAAEGYGPEHPVASNDTEAGRAENRRIAVRVTKK